MDLFKKFETLAHQKPAQVFVPLIARINKTLHVRNVELPLHHVARYVLETQHERTMHMMPAREHAGSTVRGNSNILQP